MNFLNQAGLKAGAERYGVKNARPSFDKKATCDHCGADNDPDATKCWQCKQDIDERKNASPSARENDVDCPLCLHPMSEHNKGMEESVICTHIPKCYCTTYKTRENAEATCPKCGKIYAGRLPASGKCWDCNVALDKEMDNASPSARENASYECADCGHKVSSHTDGKGNKAGCSICDCSEYVKPRENVSSSARENDDGGRCSDCEHRASNHESGKCKFEESCGCKGYKDSGNVTNADSSTLGYDAKTSTTTARSKRKIGQKFYEVGKNASECSFAEAGDPCEGRIVKITEPDGSVTKACEKHMRSGTGGSFSNASPRCPRCDEECGSMAECVKHLESEHGFSEEKAVGAMSNARENAGFQRKIIAIAECPSCHSDVTEIDANTGLCEPCFKERKNADETYTPPLLTLSQKVAAGQREYGAVNAQPSQAQVTARAKELRRKFPQDTGDMISHELTVSFPGVDREMVREAIDEAME